MNARVEAEWKRWRERPLSDPDLQKELRELEEALDQAESGAQEAVTDRFYRDLEFGTGGLRGVIGVGTNRLNVYTVARATQGYADYLNRRFEDPSVAIAHDSRIKSDVFARVAAEVFAANGVRVHMYPELMPTPSLSFAVRHLHCSGGVVITASHNPAKYNGYKVYGADGCQITTQAAKDIFRAIEAVDVFDSVNHLPFEQAMERGLVSYISDETVTAYLGAVSAGALCGTERLERDMPIVYTPLNGTGLKCVTRCLRENGFTNIHVVPEQEKPDGNFPTCPSPNPEIREALALGLRDAKRLGSELVLATDPDCDRVGIAVKDGEEYVLLSGNETGVLLLDYICRRRLALGRMPKEPVAAKTIVTTDMAAQVAADYGVRMIEVLTGFKYIGEQIGFLEQAGQADRYIFGLEESYGYLSYTAVRDKDGVDASLLICEMAAWYRAAGRSLMDVLRELYERYGYCLNTQHSIQLEGKEGLERMQAIMTDFRSAPPVSMAGRAVLELQDYGVSRIFRADGSSGEIGLPKSNVLKYLLEGNASVVIRPSGTEPKLKIYISVSAPDRESARETEKKLMEELELRLRK